MKPNDKLLGIEELIPDKPVVRISSVPGLENSTLRQLEDTPQSNDLRD